MRLDELGAGEFERVMNQWLNAYVPKANEVIPGVRDFEVGRIKASALIIRGEEGDLHRPKRTSYELGSRR